MVQGQTDRQQGYYALAERQRPCVSSCSLEETIFIGPSITIRSLVCIQQDQSLQPILSSILTYSSLMLYLRCQLEEAGYEPYRYSCHSLRRGCIPCLCQQHLGDWRSECYQHYIEDDLTLRLFAARGCLL